MFLRSLLLLFIISTTSVFGQYPVADIPEALTAGVSSVIRDQETVITLDDYNRMTHYFKEVITVFNRKGLNAIRSGVGYDKSTSVKSLEAKVFNAEGKEIKKFKKRDFVDVSASGGSMMYTDNRILSIDYVPSSFPFTFQFEYELKSSSTAFLPRWEPVPFYDMSVQKSSFTVLNKREVPVISRTYNLSQFSAVVEETPQKYYYSIENVTPIKKEFLSPYYTEFAPVVKVALQKFQLENESGFVTTWKDFGLWQNDKLLFGRDEISEETNAKIAQLVSGIEDPKEKTRVIYEYMQSKTRYVFIAIGIGGWQPSPATEVDELSYGDCKGLTNYTKALLKTQGIDSYYTIVDSGSDGRDIDEDFVALQGDHVILTVPFKDENVFLECTSQQAPFNYLGDFTDNRKVLMVTPDGGVIAKTHAYETKNNLQSLKATVVIDSDFNVTGTLNEASSGLAYGNKYFLESGTNDDVKMYYKQIWGHLNNLSLANIEFKNNKKEIVFTETLNFETDNYVSKAGDRILINPNIFNRYNNLPVADNNRTLPLQIKRGYTFSDTVEITLPEGYTIEAAFEPIILTSKFGTYKASIENVNASQFIYNRELVLHEGTFSKEEYTGYVEFIQQLVKKDKSKIVLFK